MVRSGVHVEEWGSWVGAGFMGRSRVHGEEWGSWGGVGFVVRSGVHGEEGTCKVSAKGL